jgi:enterochelin esterase-like enzyme
MLPYRHLKILAVLFTLLPLALPAQNPEPAAEPRSRRPVVWNNADGKERPGITHHVLNSRAMEREVGYNVYLPPGYADNNLRYPVLYFLHGSGGTENSDGPGFSGFVAKLIASGEIPPIICVFPNGGLSGYRDHAEDKIMVETMIIKELIPLIDASYRTRPSRDSRLIAGYSMGSAGSARLALTYPELFCAVGGWGGPLTGRRIEEPLAPGLDPASLAKIEHRPRILMIIGTDDPGLAGYGRTVRLLSEAGYEFTYRTLAGVKHNLGRYYALTGEDMVRFLLQGIAPPSAP